MIWAASSANGRKGPQSAVISETKSISAASIAFRIARTASVQPSIAISREKNRASPSSTPFIIASSAAMGPAMRASHMQAVGLRRQLIGTGSAGRTRNNIGRSSGSMRKRADACGPIRSSKSGCLRLIVTIRRRKVIFINGNGNARMATPVHAGIATLCEKILIFDRRGNPIVGSLI